MAEQPTHTVEALVDLEFDGLNYKKGDLFDVYVYWSIGGAVEVKLENNQRVWLKHDSSSEPEIKAIKCLI